MNLPMSCSSAAVWIRSCSRSATTEAAGDLACVTRDGGRMPRGHRVAHRQRLHDGAEQPDLERRELTRALVQLLPALVRGQARAHQVLEDEEHDGEQADGADADPAVTERDAGGEQPCRELGREDGQERRPKRLARRALRFGATCVVATIKKLSDVRDHEHHEHDRREAERVARSSASRRRSRARIARPPTTGNVANVATFVEHVSHGRRATAASIRMPMPRRSPRPALGRAAPWQARSPGTRRIRACPRTSTVSTSLPTARTNNSRTSSIGCQSAAVLSRAAASTANPRRMACATAMMP